MATKDQIFNVLSAASGPLSRTQIEEQIGEDFRLYQTSFNRWIKAGFIEDVGEHHYVLTEKGREEALRRGEFAEVSGKPEPAFQPEPPEKPEAIGEAEPPGKPEPSEESLATTEYQQFMKFGKLTGVVPLALIKQTADHVWNGGNFRDLKWVAQAMQEMGIRQDLRGRWFHSWRSYLKQGIPTDIPSEFFPEESKKAEEKKEEKGAGKREYILSEDDSPTYVGEGLGDLDYKDALDLAKLRTSRRKDTSPPSTSSPVDDAIKIVNLVKSHEGEKAVGKSYIVKPSEDGSSVVEEVESGKPIVVSSQSQAAKTGSYCVDSDGTVKELQPGQPVVIIKESPKLASTSGTHYLVDSKTGEVKEVAPGQPVVIIRESAPVSQLTPIQVKDKDGNPMVLDLATFIKLEEHRDKQRRDEESHQVKMDVAKEFKDLLKKASSAVTHTIEGKGEEE